MKFVTFWWQGHGEFKYGDQQPRYSAEHVRVMASMLRRHGGHELHCVTDRPQSVWGSDIRTILLPPSVAELPGFYPKVWAWSAELGDKMGERYACIDLDAVVLGDLAPLLGRDKGEMVIWDWAGGEYYNTSLFALEPGCRSWVWNDFDPNGVGEARADWLRRQIRDFSGRTRPTVWTGDQSWLSWLLGPGEATFGSSDGVRPFVAKADTRGPPAGTLAMFFCGPKCPQTVMGIAPWLKDAWR